MKTTQHESIFNKGAFKPFRDFPELHPIPFPELPKPPSLPISEKEKAEFRVIFNNYETTFYDTIEENRLRFEKAFPRIKRCCFLNGFLDPFALRARKDFMHFSWCPCNVWKEYSSQKSALMLMNIGE